MNQAKIHDLIAAGIEQGWNVTDAATFNQDQVIEADVVIVGTGAGGGIAAEMMTLAGLKVCMVEEGGLFGSSQFTLKESDAYPQLYQEGGARRTADKAITLLQGRAVGGSTTVSWASSMRIPDETLMYWREHFGMGEFESGELRRWFEQVERYLNIAPWTSPSNTNNTVLARGARKLGISTKPMARSVRDCWDLGYCSMGCPTNAKQSMLVTAIPAALDRGAALYTHLRAEKITFAHGQVRQLQCVALDENGRYLTGVRVTIRARHFILAAGAMATPALLIRSEVWDPYRHVGARTLLQPVALSAALMPKTVAAWQGAPQALYSDHFLNLDEIDGPLGFTIESAPVHPLMAAVALTGFGRFHRELMHQLPDLQLLLSGVRDGFHPLSVGGRVTLRGDGSPVLDYPLNETLWDAIRRAWLTMAEIQFAAGAKQVLPLHEDSQVWTSWQSARDAIYRLPFTKMKARLISAHVMGGAAMAREEKLGVVSSFGRHWYLENLSIMDASIFPTSLGVSPQLSVYALTARNASHLVKELTGKHLTLDDALLGPEGTPAAALS